MVGEEELDREEMRRRLSEKVDKELWGGEFKTKKSLEDAVEDLVSEAYDLCAEGKYSEVKSKLSLDETPSNLQECYDMVADKQDLSEAVKSWWGK